MKFLVDLNLSPHLARRLLEADHDAVHCADLELFTATDERILAVARDEPRVVVSADADFGTILARTRASSRRSSWSDAPKGGESNSWWTWLWRIFRPSRRTSWLAASSCWVKAPSGSAGCRSSEHQDPVRIVEVGVRRDSSPALSALPVGVPSPWSASL